MLTAGLVVACILSGLLIFGIVLAVIGIFTDKAGLFAFAVPCYFLGAFSGAAWLFTLIVWIVERVTS